MSLKFYREIQARHSVWGVIGLQIAFEVMKLR